MKLKILNEDFDYSRMAEDKWDKLLKELMDIDRMSFNLENNEPRGDDKLITVHIDDEDSEHPIKDQARCQIYCAGGDWQEPTYYFRCQVVDGRFYCSCTNKLLDQFNDSMFCLIPPKNEGNYHLEEENEKFFPRDNGVDGPKPDEKDCWKWLKDMLDKMRADAVEHIKEME